MRTNLEDDFLILLYDVARHMRTYADQIARMHGMTRAQWIILARLERQPDLSQNELAALAEVAPITASRLVDRLEELGFVKPPIEDRRGVCGSRRRRHRSCGISSYSGLSCMSS
jgi:hypothetical protein